MTSAQNCRGGVQAHVVFAKPIRAKLLLLMFVAVIAPVFAPAAGAQATATPKVTISESSIQINGVKLRVARDGFISLSAARHALGPPSNQYSWGAPIYVWQGTGIALQTGWRGPEKGKIFKFQVYLEPSYDRRTEMKSGMFRGRLQVEGIGILPDTSFQSIRAQLKSKGFVVTEQGNVTFAKKGGLEIFQTETGGKIARVDAWCL